jgi:hypothetical protein
VTEDRFGDLGPEREKSPAQRLQELDELDLEQERQARPAGPPPRPRGRYMWVVGVVFVLVVIVAGVNALRHSGGGLRGPTVGNTLPQFAAPLATSKLDGDANVKQSVKQSNQLGRKPACQVHLAGSVTSCELARKPLVLSVIVPGAKAATVRSRPWRASTAGRSRWRWTATYPCSTSTAWRSARPRCSRCQAAR